MLSPIYDLLPVEHSLCVAAWANLQLLVHELWKAHVKYEKEILEAYTRVGYKPKGNQVEYINQIVEAYIDEGHTNVILSAPTGVGKSVIGVVVAEVVHTIKGKIDQKASFLLTATNILSEQYFDSFADKTPNMFLMLKGASNYECEAMSTAQEPATAETCAIRIFRMNEEHDIIDRYCNRCEYRRTRSERDHARHLITNYSYYFVDRMVSPMPMPARTITVFDEAHLLNDLFTEHNAIEISEKRLHQITEEIAQNLKLGNTDIFKHMKVLREAVQNGNMTEDNYQNYIRVLSSCYGQIAGAYDKASLANVKNPKVYTKMQRLAKKYIGLQGHIEDLLLYEYPVVFEYKPKDVAKGQNEHVVTIKPIFVGDMFATLENAQFNLLMSATITKELADRTLTLPGTTKYIRLPPQFPTENKKMIFFKPQTLNYNTMKDPTTVKQLCANAWQIVDYHAKQNQRGIILAPSFVVAKAVADNLRVMGGVRVFEHERGQKLADVMEQFKCYPIDKPAVIITPSGYEGVDLPGEMSRYQILLKHPFGSLGDKRIKTILEQYPTIYALIALMKIVQGAGRSVRGPDDWAITYCLDNATKRVWQQKELNEWSNEFQTSFTNFLGE